jgi:penicillin amidase
MVDESLANALLEIVELQGAERDDWAWGRLHHSEIRHNMLDALPDAPERWRKIGPGPKSGSGDTVGMAAYDDDFNMTLGSTFRIVVDVGDWDRSLAMNSPGQSGDPRSPHYADLFRPWLDAESFPLLYTRASVESHASERIALRAMPQEGAMDRSGEDRESESAGKQ